MTAFDRDRWNARYAEKPVFTEVSPDIWLQQAVTGQRQGRALDLACGLGHNAIWLGLQGWRVDAVDISDVGLRIAEQSATQANCSMVTWVQADLDVYEPANTTYDLIAVFRFLDRKRLPTAIESALRPGGIVVYETFTQQHLSRPDTHIKNPRFTLHHGELPTLFPNLAVEAFEEVELEDRCVARLIARKRA